MNEKKQKTKLIKKLDNIDKKYNKLSCLKESCKVDVFD